MKKIVIAQPMHMYPDQIERLKKLGSVTFYDEFTKSSNEWLERVQGADIICSNKTGLKQKIYDLENVYMSLPFVGVGWMDLEKLKARNIIVSCCPGCNKEAVSEWMLTMILNLAREIPAMVNNDKMKRNSWTDKTGLAEKNVTVLGHGNIGSRIGEVLKVLLMNVTYFDKGDNLLEKVKDADFVVNALSENPGTIGLLDAEFFQSLKQGVYFVTITSSTLYDADAMISEIKSGRIAGAADDCGTIDVGDSSDPYYLKLTANLKILTTPHIAARTDVTCRKSYDMMIDNIEHYLKGELINLV